ncbi:MAG: hypothetical protein R6V62_03085 [Candidatus Fermentibacteraceae bacterium]
MKNLVITALVTAASVAAQGTDPAGEVNLNHVIHNLELGMNTEEFLAVLGDDFTRVISMMVDAEVWRYDFPTEPGYTFTVPSGEDEVDTGGLGSGSMRMQVFVVWNESGLLGDYTVYTGNANGVITEYRVFPDGSVRKSRL